VLELNAQGKNAAFVTDGRSADNENRGADISSQQHMEKAYEQSNSMFVNIFRNVFKPTAQ
jgi:hypothetical protein